MASSRLPLLTDDSDREQAAVEMDVKSPVSEPLPRSTSRIQMALETAANILESVAHESSSELPRQFSRGEMLSISPRSARSTKVWTIVGVCAISFWSTTFAASRVVSEALGALTSMGICFFVGGVVSTLIYGAFGRVGGMFQCPLAYYLQCGVPCIMYPVLLYSGFHFVVKNEEVITLTVLNYLWPQLMSIMTILTFGNRWRMSLLFGLTLALCSILLVNLKPGMSVYELLGSFVTIWAGGSCATAGAFCWAFYSVRASYWAALYPNLQTAVPVFTMASGLGLLLIRVFVDEHHPGPFDLTFWASMIYVTVVPSCVCRFAWDYACSWGNLLVLTSFAYLTPFLATMWNIVLLGLDWNANAILGSFGLAIAAIITKLSIV
eukprot:TRINITY_DN20557_c2_g1_i1.p1 TRINITY_DN20557_c2_g1~~TRINITY_DN20557_c2_g1_i1.p1  ORF type:complete len:400 (-),score=32.39 TRINITY_DN20557_c2_g1_i1:249-1385(-)